MLKHVLLIGLCVWAMNLNADSADAEVDAPKEMSGMSVLGNSEAPKSLVIVPWKTSQIGDGIGIANMLDGRAVPVDKEVFNREVEFYELTRNASPRDLTGTIDGSHAATQQ